MRAFGRFLLIILVLFSCVGCDQVTKNIARQDLPTSGPISFIYDIFRLQYTENPGGFLSLGAASSESVRFWFLIFFTGLFLLGLLVYLIASSNNTKTQTISLSLVAGGGISNLIDRIFHDGRVIDFMNVGVGPLRTGIFNIADIAIMCGVVWLIAVSIKREKNLDF